MVCVLCVWLLVEARALYYSDAANFNGVYRTLGGRAKRSCVSRAVRDVSVYHTAGIPTVRTICGRVNARSIRVCSFCVDSRRNRHSIKPICFAEFKID